MDYNFFGWQSADVSPIEHDYDFITNQRKLYDALDKCWSEQTCAPRLRKHWNQKNKTLGQCSITAFLVQDIFGGEVYGIPLSDGSVHCYNVVGESMFDLTSEQFGGERLEYKRENPQSRDVHFADSDKKARYELLKSELLSIDRDI